MRTAAGYDVVVVGAGPAGACTAALLARRGHRVALLHAPGQPGPAETLFTGIRSVAGELGLLTRLDAVAARRCPGYTVHGPHGERTVSFGGTGPHPFGHHVDRARLDALLVARAAELGATVLRGRAREVVVTDGRVRGVRLGLGRARTLSARLVLDASGPARVVVSRVAAGGPSGPSAPLLHTILRGCRPGSDRLLVERGPGAETLSWLVPLGDGRAQLACLLPPGADPDRRDALRAALHPDTRLRRAVGHGRIDGPVRRTVVCPGPQGPLHGPGWAAAGDAGWVLHPPLGGGAALAMITAAPLAQAVDLVLRGAAAEDEAMTRYARGCRDLLTDVVAHVHATGAGPAGAVPLRGQAGAGLDVLLCGMVGLRSDGGPPDARDHLSLKNEPRTSFRSRP